VTSSVGLLLAAVTDSALSEVLLQLNERLAAEEMEEVEMERASTSLPSRSVASFSRDCCKSNISSSFIALVWGGV
jgi:hypothetical protein